MLDNSTFEAMESQNYVIDESFLRTTNNRLLDKEGTGPNRALSQPGEVALAAIAQAIHKHARHLSPEQAELAVKWLKKWKLRDAVPHDYNHTQVRDAFDAKLKALRESPEQVRLQSVAARHGTWSRVWAAVCAGALAVMVGMGAASGAGAVAWIIAAAVLVGSLIASERSLVRALAAAKEQDRKYLFQSFQAASTVSELLNSGFFAQVPGVSYTGVVDEKLNARQSYAERERLADALYLDPDGCLDQYSFRDTGPRV